MAFLTPSLLTSRPVVFILAAVLVITGLAAGCNTNERDPDAVPTRAYDGEARPYRMGVSSLPVELTEEAYREAFQVAGQSGEVILIQRPPAWDEFRDGGTISDATRQTTQAEKMLAADLELDFFVAIDVLDPANREQVALPEDWAGRSIGDPEVRAAYLGYVEYMAANYQPAYMALAVEVNVLYEQDREEFEAYLDVYEEAYARAKKASPETKVFVTFQYEELLGLIPWKREHAPRWELASVFEPYLDAFAISTYPSFVFPRADDVPADYYTQLREFTTLPALVAESGYASAPGPSGVNSGTEGDQARYVTRLLQDAEAVLAELVIWFAAADPNFGDEAPYELFRSIGLRRSDGTPKLALQPWQDMVHRPPPTP